MAALGLSAPDSLFGTPKRAMESIAAIAGAVKTFGATATLSEIILTVPSLTVAIGDYAVLGTAVSATFYLGACIGSVAVALGRSMSGGRQIIDFFEVGRKITNDNALIHKSHAEYHRAGGRLRYSA